jgi:hypothetical protein
MAAALDLPADPTMAASEELADERVAEQIVPAWD